MLEDYLYSAVLLVYRSATVLLERGRRTVVVVVRQHNEVSEDNLLD